MVKQISKKTRGQEELAHAIAIAGADCSLVEERKLLLPVLEWPHTARSLFPLA